jgi:hypothetical protein
MLLFLVWQHQQNLAIKSDCILHYNCIYNDFWTWYKELSPLDNSSHHARTEWNKRFTIYLKDHTAKAIIHSCCDPIPHSFSSCCWHWHHSVEYLTIIERGWAWYEELSSPQFVFSINRSWIPQHEIIILNMIFIPYMSECVTESFSLHLTFLLW